MLGFGTWLLEKIKHHEVKKMKMLITLIGLLTILGGLLPLLANNNLLPGFLASVPTTGTGYQMIIVLIGVIALIYGVKFKDPHVQQ